MVSFFLGLPIPAIDINDPVNLPDKNDFMIAQYWRIPFALPIAFALL